MVMVATVSSNVRANQNFAIETNSPLKALFKTIKVSIRYFVIASKEFVQDIYDSCFSYKIITKLPFFIFFYGFYTALGLIDTIYYVAITIFVLKASKDLIEELQKRNALKNIKEYFPINKDMLSNIAKGSIIAPFVFILDRLITKFITICFQSINLNVFEEEKLIFLKGFIGKFSIVYAILIYPIIKEVLFRGYIQDYFSDKTKIKNDNLKFLKTAFKTSLIFGLYAFGPTCGFLNVPIMIVSVSISMIFSLINKKTKSLWASSFCSIIYSLLMTIHLKEFRTIR
jgi:membrane protease YdiL (CAAX protease family)